MRLAGVGVSYRKRDDLGAAAAQAFTDIDDASLSPAGESQVVARHPRFSLGPSQRPSQSQTASSLVAVRPQQSLQSGNKALSPSNRRNALALTKTRSSHLLLPFLPLSTTMFSRTLLAFVFAVMAMMMISAPVVQGESPIGGPREAEGGKEGKGRSKAELTSLRTFAIPPFSQGDYRVRR